MPTYSRGGVAAKNVNTVTRFTVTLPKIGGISARNRNTVTPFTVTPP